MKPSGWSMSGLTPPAFSSTGLRGATICNKFRRFSAWSASRWHVDASAQALFQASGTELRDMSHETEPCVLVPNTCRNSRLQIKTIAKRIGSSVSVYVSSELFFVSKTIPVSGTHIAAIHLNKVNRINKTVSVFTSTSMLSHKSKIAVVSLYNIINMLCPHCSSVSNNWIFWLSQ